VDHTCPMSVIIMEISPWLAYALIAVTFYILFLVFTQWVLWTIEICSRKTWWKISESQMIHYDDFEEEEVNLKTIGDRILHKKLHYSEYRR
jgi:hypothetical protein